MDISSAIEVDDRQSTLQASPQCNMDILNATDVDDRHSTLQANQQWNMHMLSAVEVGLSPLTSSDEVQATAYLIGNVLSELLNNFIANVRNKTPPPFIISEWSACTTMLLHGIPGIWGTDESCCRNLQWLRQLCQGAVLHEEKALTLRAPIWDKFRWMYLQAQHWCDHPAEANARIREAYLNAPPGLSSQSLDYRPKHQAKISKHQAKIESSLGDHPPFSFHPITTPTAPKRVRKRHVRDEDWIHAAGNQHVSDDSAKTSSICGLTALTPLLSKNNPACPAADVPSETIDCIQPRLLFERPEEQVLALLPKHMREQILGPAIPKQFVQELSTSELKRRAGSTEDEVDQVMAIFSTLTDYPGATTPADTDTRDVPLTPAFATSDTRKKSSISFDAQVPPGPPSTVEITEIRSRDADQPSRPLGVAAHMTSGLPQWIRRTTPANRNDTATAPAIASPSIHPLFSAEEAGRVIEPTTPPSARGTGRGRGSRGSRASGFGRGRGRGRGSLLVVEYKGSASMRNSPSRGQGRSRGAGVGRPRGFGVGQQRGAGVRRPRGAGVGRPRKCERARPTRLLGP